MSDPIKSDSPDGAVVLPRLVRPLPISGEADCPRCGCQKSVSRHNADWTCQAGCGFHELADPDRECDHKYAAAGLNTGIVVSDACSALVVCLCGSSRWPELHHRVMMEETLAGNIVIPMGLYGHADYPPGAKAITNDGDEATAVKQMLDRLHFQKIDLADEIIVVSEDGYFGSSTRREIAYAAAKGKRVRYWQNAIGDSQSPDQKS